MYHIAESFSWGKTISATSTIRAYYSHSLFPFSHIQFSLLLELEMFPRKLNKELIFVNYLISLSRTMWVFIVGGYRPLYPGEQSANRLPMLKCTPRGESLLKGSVFPCLDWLSSHSLVSRKFYLYLFIYT